MVKYLDKFLDAQYVLVEDLNLTLRCPVIIAQDIGMTMILSDVNKYSVWMISKESLGQIEDLKIWNLLYLYALKIYYVNLYKNIEHINYLYNDLNYYQNSKRFIKSI